MDVQIVAGLAPAADQIVYFSTFDEQGWVDLINQVVAGKPAAAVSLSVSWGLAEDDPNWSQGALQAIDERLQAAAVLGITVCIASGDDGSADAETDGRAHVDFPASSPHTLAVGGTMLTGRHRSGLVGIAGRAHQQRRGLHRRRGERGLPAPELAGRADRLDQRRQHRRTCDSRHRGAWPGPPWYDLIFMGQDQPNGGTSASTPLWAALIARLAAAPQQPWKPRYLAPLLYAAGSGGQPVGATACTDITSGDNTASTLGKGYSAGPGFDAVSGWGVPERRCPASGAHRLGARVQPGSARVSAGPLRVPRPARVAVSCRARPP